MSEVTGIFVSLSTANQSWAGTNNHVYIGIVGTVGGREFPLAVRGFDDFEEGDTVTYSIGPGADVFNGLKPETSDQSLASAMICQENVTHVYLRKQGSLSHDGDDIWRLQSAYVYVIGSGPTRVFKTTGTHNFGNEWGNQAWLGETGHSGSYRNAHLVFDGAADCSDDG